MSPVSAMKAGWDDPRLHAWLPALLPTYASERAPPPDRARSYTTQALVHGVRRPGGGRRAIHRRLVAPTTLYSNDGGCRVASAQGCEHRIRGVCATKINKDFVFLAKKYRLSFLNIY